MTTLDEKTPPDEQTPPATLARIAHDTWRFLGRDHLDYLPPPDPLIDGLLPRRGLAMLAGSRGLGKSLLALDIAATVATGRPTWAGLPVACHGPVLYLSAEGFQGVPNRVRAWEAVHGRRAAGVVWFPDPVDLRHQLHARMIGAAAHEGGTVAVVVDSARATGAGAEDTKDMGDYVKGLEVLAASSDALVLVLHNTGWDETRERGSTLLPDACDTTLLLTGDPEPDGVRLLRHRKHRDGDMLPDPLAFTFHHVDGTKSGVLVPSGLADREQTTRDVVLAAVAEHPGHGTGEVAGLAGRNRQNVSAALASLTADGLLINRGTKARPRWHVLGANEVLS